MIYKEIVTKSMVDILPHEMMGFILLIAQKNAIPKTRLISNISDSWGQNVKKALLASDNTYITSYIVLMLELEIDMKLECEGDTIFTLSHSKNVDLNVSILANALHNITKLKVSEIALSTGIGIQNINLIQNRKFTVRTMLGILSYFKAKLTIKWND